MPETGVGTKDNHGSTAPAETGITRAPATGLAVVYATFPAGPAAQETARRLVEDGLAACVNIIPGMTAVYAWQGQIHEDAETIALIKTRSACVPEVIEAVRRTHPYTTPALISLGIDGGSAAYVAWVLAQTGNGTSAVVTTIGGTTAGDAMVVSPLPRAAPAENAG